MGNHHAFRARRCPAGVVDAQQVAFVNGRFEELRRRRGQVGFIVEPAVARAAFERDEVFHVWELVANAVDCLEVITVGAYYFGATMADDVGEIVGC